MADEVKHQVALAMSQQQQQQAAPAEPIVDAAGLSQCKSSCASTGLPADIGIAAIDTTAEQHYPVDEITQRTPCSKNLRFTVAYSSAMPKHTRRGVPWVEDPGWIRQSWGRGGVQ